jgi:cytoskeletal protein CcmA (bactofilin family)
LPRRESAPSPSTGGSPSGSPTPAERCQNFLAPGARFEGTLTVDDSIRVEGTFSGQIQTGGTLQITSGAQVRADIHASYVVIAGSFEGQIDSDQRIDLLPPGRIRADLRTRRLVVEDGAEFDGKIEMNPSPAPQPAPATTSSSSRRSSEGSNR